MSGQRTIGVLMDYFSADVVEGAGAYARQHGLRIDARWSVRADWMPADPGWDAAILGIVDAESSVEKVREMGIPKVHLSVWKRRKAPLIQIDYVGVGIMAAREFRDLGLQRVLVQTNSNDPIAKRCFAGLRLEGKRLGLEVSDLQAWRDVSVPVFPDRLRMAAAEIAGLSGSWGLFSPHSGLLYSMVEELTKVGVSIPDQVAIIGMEKDVQRTSELASIPLTTIAPDHWQQGYEAARIVHRLMERKPLRRRILRIGAARVIRRDSTGRPTSRDPMVAKVLHGVRILDFGELSVEAIVKYAGLSRRALEQRFRKEVGRTLHEEITRRKMREAQRLLRQSDYTVAEIADRCGYSGVHYFSTAFKREVGQPPSAFRKGQEGVA